MEEIKVQILEENVKEDYSDLDLEFSIELVILVEKQQIIFERLLLNFPVSMGKSTSKKERYFLFNFF